MSGIVEATEGAFSRHPFLWGGGFLAVVVLLYVYSGSSKSPNSAAQSFNFSYGPSDAQVVAGTQLQIAQVQANAQSSQLATQTASNDLIAQDYFGYLTNNSANSLTATMGAQSTSAAIAGLQSKGQLAQIASSQAVSINQATLNYNASAQAASNSYNLASQQISSTERTTANQLASANQLANTNANLQFQEYAAGGNANSSTIAALMQGWSGAVSSGLV